MHTSGNFNGCLGSRATRLVAEENEKERVKEVKVKEVKEMMKEDTEEKVTEEEEVKIVNLKMKEEVKEAQNAQICSSFFLRAMHSRFFQRNGHTFVDRWPESNTSGYFFHSLFYQARIELTLNPGFQTLLLPASSKTNPLTPTAYELIRNTISTVYPSLPLPLRS